MVGAKAAYDAKGIGTHMGRQSRGVKRQGRFGLRWLHDRSSDATDAIESRRARLTRYGVRALLVAGAAGAAWLMSGQAASAAPTHEASRQGLLPAASRTLGSLTESLIGSGGACVAGDACGRHAAATHGGAVGSHSTVAPRAVFAAPDVNSSASTGGVRDHATGTQNPAGTAKAGDILGPVLDVTRPVTGSLTTRVLPGAGHPNQGAATDVLGGVLQPVTSAIADTTRPVTGTLTGPLADTTRPVDGLLNTAARPLPGACGAVVTPLTGVLTSQPGPQSRPAAPHHTAPVGVSDGPANPTFPHCGQVVPVQHGTGAPSATWTTSTAITAADRMPGTPLPGLPEPAPLAYPGSGACSGGMASASGVHSGAGVFAPAGSPVVRADSASRVAPSTAQAGLPRLYEVDPVIFPD